MDTTEVEARLRRTFDAVAATTRVDVAPERGAPDRRGDRRPAASTLLPVGALFAAVIAVVLILLFTGTGSPTHVRTSRPADSTEPTVAGLKARPGMMVVGDEAGHPVGYVHLSDIHMPPKEYFKKVNARTLWPVTDANGVLVGYLAPDVPFIPLSVVDAPGFDIEKVRAERNGGCEEQIGDPHFKQEFPRCPGEP